MVTRSTYLGQPGLERGRLGRGRGLELRHLGRVRRGRLGLGRGAVGLETGLELGQGGGELLDVLSGHAGFLVFEGLRGGRASWE